MEVSREMAQRKPIVLVNGLYTGSARGLQSDLIAADRLEWQSLSVCTLLVAAGAGKVTDVLSVPADYVRAQLEQIAITAPPAAVRLVLLGSPAAAQHLFDWLGRLPDVPVLLNLTLSGQSGEDLVEASTLEAVKSQMSRMALVSVHRRDAALVAGMEITTLDDAQVALQRLHRLGAQRVLLRCGALPAHDFGPDPLPYATDLYYDGEDFSLFEAPLLPSVPATGKSSLLDLAVLDGLTRGLRFEEAIQQAKAYTTETLNRR